jgi:cytidylate kinase
MTLPPVGPTRHVDVADPAQVTAVVQAARSASPVVGRTVVVAVDGRSGSGKTVVGTAVAATLGCPVVHLDAIYPGWDGLAAGVALATTHVLEPVARGEQAAYPRWDWMRSRPGRTIVVDAGPHLVLEGCGALVPPAEAFAAVRVWVEAPTEVRKVRALSRDGETYAPHWDRWAAQEDAVYAAARPWESADLVLRTVAP